ncbi:ATP-binding protein, partial [Leptospira interrogans]|nr:ATP-grasp domain-containing protein [Leptospira interrogans serovar Pomona]
SRIKMEASGVPVVPGYNGQDQNPNVLQREAEKIGYPLMIKATAGGGGKGMKRVYKPEEFLTSLESAQREAQKAFGDGTVFLEKYIEMPRHIEVQVFGDKHGNVMHLFERECSI